MKKKNIIRVNATTLERLYVCNNEGIALQKNDELYYDRITISGKHKSNSQYVSLRFVAPLPVGKVVRIFPLRENDNNCKK